MYDDYGDGRYDMHINVHPPPLSGISEGGASHMHSNYNVHDYARSATPPYPVNKETAIDTAMANMNISSQPQQVQQRHESKGPEVVPITQGQKNVQKTLSSESDHTNGVVEASKKERIPDLSTYSPEALRFYEIYQQTILDASKFTPKVQMQWCENLLLVSQDDAFIKHYTINAEQLRRELKAEEVQRNQTIILQHAFKVLSKLIRLKCPEAYYLMGSLYSHRVTTILLKNYDFIVKNDEKALEYYCEGAKLGHADCAFRSGVSFEFMKGVKTRDKLESMNEAFKYYEMGSKNCHSSDCMFKLGMFYVYEMIPGINNIELGIKWFENAIKVGNSNQACYELGKLYEFDGLPPAVKERIIQQIGKSFKDNSQSLKYYYKCALEFDYPLAQWKLGYSYELGELGLPIDAKKSIAWYFRAVTIDPERPKKKNLNPMAMLALSGWYLTGASNVLQPNWNESFSWVQKACRYSDGKLARAEFILAYYYQNGIGCKQDMDMARQHFQIAANLGYPKATDYIA